MNANDRSAEWAFVSASSLVSALGVLADLADPWRTLISTNVNLASPGNGVVVGVTSRKAYPPLIQIAQSKSGKSDDYNPDGLRRAPLFILVPPGMVLAATKEADRLHAEQKRLASEEAERLAEAARWEAGREAREKVAAELMAPVKITADKYRLTQLDVLSPGNKPNWLFAILLKHTLQVELTRDELLLIKKSDHLYFAAAAYWHAWEANDDPWDAVEACSLLRRTNDHKKALNLSRKLHTGNWDSRVKSALLTTRGGALRDVGELEQAWQCAQDALKSNDTSPHPFMLLGALCYQTDRKTEGDAYFRNARERGATERQIDGIRADAESRKKSVSFESNANQ